MKGWSGINIDLSAISIDLFKLARPRDINICALLSDSKSVHNVYQNGDGLFDCLNSVKYAREGCDTVSRLSTTFDCIADRCGLGACIDFISIDAEGSDYEVLKSIDLDIYRPKLICIEQLESNMTGSNALMHDHLALNGYQRIKRMGCSVFYSRPTV